MANEAALDELQNVAIKLGIEYKMMNNSKHYKSIIDVDVFMKKEKHKWFIFPYNKTKRAIKFTVNENEAIYESMVKDLNLKELLNLYVADVHDEFLLEVVYV